MESSFGKWLGHKSGALLNGICILRKRSLRTAVPLVRCEDTLEKVLSVKQQVGLHQTQSTHFDSGLPSQLSNMLLLIKRYFVDGILLWQQPKHTKTRHLDLSFYSFTQWVSLCARGWSWAASKFLSRLAR